MRINRLNTVNNSPTDKIQELTIYHYLTNNNTTIVLNKALKKGKDSICDIY